LRARRTRRAIDRYYRKNPDAAVAYVNARFDEANKTEEALCRILESPNQERGQA